MQTTFFSNTCLSIPGLVIVVITLLQQHNLYKRLGRDDVTRQAANRGLFNAHLDDEVIDSIRYAMNDNYVLSDGLRCK